MGRVQDRSVRSNLCGGPRVQCPAERKDEPHAGARTLVEQLRAAGGNDASLAAGGDALAFGRLYHQHCGRVHSLARRMAGEEGADELTQDVFVRAWEKLHTFRGESAFGTWLHRLAINLILARRASWAKRRSRDAGDAALATLPGRSAGPELRMDFEKALERLPGGAREVLVLFDVEGYRHEEIAEMLGISVGTSKSQLHRARMRLREHLS